MGCKNVNLYISLPLTSLKMNSRRFCNGYLFSALAFVSLSAALLQGTINLAYSESITPVPSPHTLNTPFPAAKQPDTLTGHQQGRRSYIVTIHRMIDGGLSSSIKRRVPIALENNAEMIIFDIDTFGGRLDAAIEISEYISSVDDVTTVAFISHKAISAGALIAIACDNIIMAPEAEFGDCEPILPSSEGGYKTAGEKIQTVLRTKFRKFAEKNGYPVILAEAMVTSEIEVYKIETEDSPEPIYVSTRTLTEMPEDERQKITKKTLIIEKGKLLTMHTREAVEYGFASKIVDDIRELPDLYGLNNDQMIPLDTNWSEELARFLEKISPFLLTIGIIAIYLELKAPGFGIPGIIGILCLGAMFLSKHMAGLAEAPEIIIFFVGVALIAAEIFLIPGFGITGIAGAVCVFIGLILSFQEFTIPRTPFDTEILHHNLLVIIGSFLASSFVIILLMKYMPGLPLFNRLILATAETQRYGFETITSSSHIGIIGKRGIAVTPLHPAGHVELGETVLDVVTQGDFINIGQEVEIIEVDGNHIVVKAVE